jgi:hypothetical protein
VYYSDPRIAEDIENDHLVGLFILSLQKTVRQHLIYICQVVCLYVCMYESSERPGRWTNPHQIWYGGLTLQGPGHRLCFGPRGGPPGSGGP